MFSKKQTNKKHNKKESFNWNKRLPEIYSRKAVLLGKRESKFRVNILIIMSLFGPISLGFQSNNPLLKIFWVNQCLPPILKCHPKNDGLFIGFWKHLKNKPKWIITLIKQEENPYIMQSDTSELSGQKPDDCIQLYLTSFVKKTSGDGGGKEVSSFHWSFLISFPRESPALLISGDSSFVCG